MQITKCDRCGKLDELAGTRSLGTDSFYIGEIKLYQYFGQEEAPEINSLDLCRNCQVNLDEFVNKYMEEMK